MRSFLIFILALIITFPVNSQIRQNSQKIKDFGNDSMYPLQFYGFTYSMFGNSVSDAGDMNGDGYDDIIIGALGYNSNTGRAFIYFGGENMNNSPDVTLTGENSADNFGCSVSGAGDINGDGFGDVVVGAHGYNLDHGKVYIYFGGSVMNNTADVIISGETGAGSHFGQSVSSAGDVNGDGFSDVITGAFVYGGSIGRAYIFYGGALMDTVSDVTMTGEGLNNYFGYSVSSAGDMNNDNYGDVIISALRNNSYTGKAYVYFGGAAMNNIADVSMYGETAGDNFGLSVSGAGDVNDDGYSDVIVGAPYYSSYKGRTYIYYGGPVPNNTPSVVMTGSASNNFFGISVSTSGDVNNDGYDDVIAGSIGYSSYQGRSYIFYGGAAMNNIFDVAVNGENTNTNFGGSVSSAGDTDNDGYSDFIIGASSLQNGIFPYTGRAYLYSGSTISMNLNLTLIIEGFYIPETFTQISDSVKVYLRNISFPYSIVDSTVTVFSEYGNTFPSFSNAANGTYYIVLKHRNSIETWSKSGGENLINGNTLNYDFTASADQAYGNNLAEMYNFYTFFALYSGDIDQDGTIDASDLSYAENDAANSVSGYVRSDVTGDDFVDAGDLSIVENNASAGISAVTP
ncbi:MAG TPA: FG-GAP-like repeat-containing protein [Ignavibacteria bacterium]|nr:FG-GAP-like repeat-containing protein [Ignavibacteria bacterium]